MNVMLNQHANLNPTCLFNLVTAVPDHNDGQM